MTRYTLAVSFKSNEHPWSTEYAGAPPGPQTEEEAREWLQRMSDHLPEYTVTLLADGKPLKPKEPYMPTMDEYPSWR